MDDGGTLALRMGQGFVQGLGQVFSERAHSLCLPRCLIESASLATALRLPGPVGEGWCFGHGLVWKHGNPMGQTGPRHHRCLD